MATPIDQLRAPGTEPPSPAGRPRIVRLLGGVALVVFLVGLAGLSFQGKLSDVQKNDNSAFLPASADSTKVYDAAQKFTPVQTIPGFVVYQRASGLTTADKARIASDITAFREIAGVAADQVAAQPVARTGSVQAVSVPLVGKADGVSKTGPELVDTEKAVLAKAEQNANGMTVYTAGAGGLLVAFIDAFQGIDGTLLLAAGAVVIVILLFVYRSPVLWFFPLFSALLALGAAALVIYPLAKHNVITLNGQSQGILFVLVIGAGTDYALLLVSRYREELHEHESRLDAMVAAWKGAAPPIAASGTTVMLGLLCMMLADLKATAGLGPVCAIGIVCTLAVMLTVLPALLVVSGRWIFWPRRPRVDHATDIATHGMWARFANAITRNRRRSWAISGVALLACVLGLLQLKTGGLTTEQSFTNKPEAVTGTQLYNAAYPAAQGAGAPADILVRADKAQAVIGAVQQLRGVVPNGVCPQLDYRHPEAFARLTPQALAQLKATGCAPRQFWTAVSVKPIGGQLLLSATLTDPYDTSAAYDTVRRIRAAVSTIPGADALVGGSSATNLDVQDASRRDRNLIIPVVLLVILVVLGLVLRALFAPVLLILTVVLSFAASLGVSALVFDHLFHFANADPAFPLFAFVFLVALGIDYNIFLMTRVREESLQYGTRRGIVRGLSVTGGVITSAGVVLAATFVVLGVLPLVFLAEIGFTVAFGVLLDTIVVRSILVPSLSYDIGKRIWWPSRLAVASARD